MIPVPSHVRIWLAVGRTDMRRGMQGLALQVQEALGRDPYGGDLYIFNDVTTRVIRDEVHRDTSEAAEITQALPAQ